MAAKGARMKSEWVTPPRWTEAILRVHSQQHDFTYVGAALARGLESIFLVPEVKSRLKT